MGERRKKMKAYILNGNDGIVLIGDMVFQISELCLKSFQVDKKHRRRGLTKHTPRYEVKSKTWLCAIEAFQKYLEET